MAKTAAELKKEPKTVDAEQFQRFLEAARKRRLDESLEDFAARFDKIAPAKPQKAPAEHTGARIKPSTPA